MKANEVPEKIYLQVCGDCNDNDCDNCKFEDLEKAAVEAFKQIVDSDKNNFLEIFKAGARWQKDKKKEPISNDFEQALEAEWKGYVDRGAATVDALEDNTQELTFAKGFYRGVLWQKEKDSISAKDLEEVISYLSKRYPEVSFAKLSRIAVRVAKWQKEKEYTCYEEAFEDGAKWKNEQLMAKAIDGDITFDYYSNDNKTYGCIAHDSFCLEDFGLKDRDKVKVIVIKED